MKEQDATTQKRENSCWSREKNKKWVSKNLELNKWLKINVKKIPQETEQKDKEMKNTSYKN